MTNTHATLRLGDGRTIPLKSFEMEIGYTLLQQQDFNEFHLWSGKRAFRFVSNRVNMSGLLSAIRFYKSKNYREAHILGDGLHFIYRHITRKPRREVRRERKRRAH